MRQYTTEGKSAGKHLLSQNSLYYQFDSTLFVYITMLTFNFTLAKQSVDNPFDEKEEGTRRIVEKNP